MVVDHAAEQALGACVIEACVIQGGRHQNLVCHVAVVPVSGSASDSGKASACLTASSDE